MGPRNTFILSTAVNILTLVRSTIARMDKLKFWKNINIYLKQPVDFQQGKLNLLSLGWMDI